MPETYKEISEYYNDTTIGKCQKIEKTGEAFGGLCLIIIDIGNAVKDISVADIKLMAEALETGSKTALAMATGDIRAMGQSLKHLLTEEAVEAFADMTNKRCHALACQLIVARSTLLNPCCGIPVKRDRGLRQRPPLCHPAAPV